LGIILILTAFIWISPLFARIDVDFSRNSLKKKVSFRRKPLVRNGR